MSLKITDPPPDEINTELLELKTDLDNNIPPKLLDRNLLIATWNIRRFGPITTKWKSHPDGGPIRDYHSILCIAEIIKRFDVVALNELWANAEGFHHLLKVLGNNWGFMLSDIAGGSRERLAFLFDSRKLTPTGLVGEYVIAPKLLESAGTDSLKEQFLRTPYIASFRVGSKMLTLVNVHIVYGKIGDETKKELAALVQWLRELAEEKSVWQSNIIVLGDMNIRRKGDKMYKAFVSTGLHIPKALMNLARTIRDDPENPEWFYDQIAWFKESLSLNYTNNAGNFDFTRTALKSRNLSLNQLSYCISDHLPLWVEFSLRD
jgi:endonuclease/exonuclease/phosphatase family metal-dependent hydrolase